MTDGAIDGSGLKRDKPWKDGELLRELYIDEQMSMNQIRKEWDCSINTVRKWLDEHGIEKRGRSEACKLAHGNHPRETPYLIGPFGAEVWKYCFKGDKATIFVHRLAAVAKYGFDEVAENAVHHKNGCRFDNRPENLELMEHGDHTVHHKTKLDPETRREIADRYENTDDSSYTIADDYPICAATVRFIHKRHFGDDNGGEKAV